MRNTGRPRKTPQQDVNPRQWRDDDSVINSFIFNPDNGDYSINPDLYDTLYDGSPIDFYHLIVDQNIINNIVIETNKYAAQKIASKVISPHSRLNKWYDTNESEMKCFLGLLMWTGLVSLPSYDLYWSTSVIFKTEFSTFMSRNRFEILLQMIHFADNSQADPNNRLYKLGRVINDVMTNSNNCMQPYDSFCIDESLIKFMGRLSFKQYIKNKKSRFGIKLFKLCISPCYTLAIKVYAGKEANAELNVGSKIVLELSEPYLDCGRTLYVDNWYTSIELAESLNDRQTHLVGTLRANRKSNPKDVTQKKLKRGEVVSMRSFSNILVLKWKDKRDLYMLSTKHNSEMISIDHRGKCIEKPKVVIDYNLGKSPIDLSDQLSSYSNPLRRSIKWYRKVVLDTLLNIGVVNSLVLFNKVTNSKMKITAFRTILVENLVKKNDIMPPEVTMNHDFVKAGRSRCFKCYKKMVSEKGRTYAQNHSTKVYTKCLACNKYYCQMCFMRDHKIKK